MNTYNMDKMYESYASGMESMQMWLDESEQENKQLKEENEFLKSEIEEAKRIIQKYLEYIDERDERINKAIEYIKIYRSYQKIDNKDYLKGRDEIGCLDICQVDELLDILKGVE